MGIDFKKIFGFLDPDKTVIQPTPAPAPLPTNPSPIPEKSPIYGVDVSAYQGDIDWLKVKASGIDFAFIKATEGELEVDPKFKANWDGVQNNNPGAAS